MPDRTSPSQDDGRIIRFRPRGASPSGWRWPVPRPRPREPPVADLTKYQRSQGEDDYRHRMTMNALALVSTTMLVVIGIWLAVSIADHAQEAGLLSCRRTQLQSADDSADGALTAPRFEF